MNATAHSEYVGLRDVLIWLKSGLLRLAIPTVTFALLAIVYVVKKTPEYESSVLLKASQSDDSMLPGGLSGSLGSLVGLAGVGTESVTLKDEAIALIKSRQFLRGFFERHQIVQEMYSGRWDAQEGEWVVSDEEIPTFYAAHRRFLKKVLNVSEDQKTGLITLSMTVANREMAPIWVTELVKDANEQMRARAISDATRSLNYLSDSLESTSSNAIRDAMFALVEQQSRKQMLAAVKPDFALQVLDPPIESPIDKPVRPNKLLWLFAMTVFGLIVGLVWHVLATAFSNSPRH